MSVRTRQKEFGDFQTPPTLAAAVCACLVRAGMRPATLIEPTCGVGSFLFAGLDAFPDAPKALGLEINPTYVETAAAGLQSRHDHARATVQQADFFATAWEEVIAGLPEPILFLGNLPWVTNAELGSLASTNLPAKSNIRGDKGLDALTGKANFDIAEWMLLRVLAALRGRRGTLALLCKTSSARKTLEYAWRSPTPPTRAALFRIDARREFGAAVDAVLFVAHVGPGRHTAEAPIYPDLTADQPAAMLGFADGLLLADAKAYKRWRHLAGETPIRWRSGIKHDCAAVMEFHREEAGNRNGLGELVDLEADYLYPMLKSSQLANGRTDETNRVMLVTQQAVGEDTAAIRSRAPRTWAYLQQHAAQLGRRGSSIYRGRPAFSMFGIGAYSFAPWKVAISGLYKRLAFAVVGPANGRPVMLDDTAYFMPCTSREQAVLLAGLLNAPPAQAFYEAFIFWDAKRPITADLLRRLDLMKLARELGRVREYLRHFPAAPATHSLFPESA